MGPSARRTLIRLYPRRWRERYAREFEELLGATPLTTTVLLDLAQHATLERLHGLIPSRSALLAALHAPVATWRLCRRILGYVVNAQDDLDALYGDRATRRAALPRRLAPYLNIGDAMAANITSGSGGGF